jgi:hypothetical protein
VGFQVSNEKGLKKKSNKKNSLKASPKLLAPFSFGEGERLR